MRTIHSLKDLKKAKKELAIRKAHTKQEFARHLGTLRQDATGYVVKKVVLPVGIGLALAFVARYFFFNKDQKSDQEESAGKKSQETQEEVQENVNKNTWLSYFSILLSIIKIYQSGVAQKQAKAAAERQQEATATEHQAKNPEAENVEPVEGEDDAEAFSPKNFVRQYHRQKTEE
jgi:hypothetical protein